MKQKHQNLIQQLINGVLIVTVLVLIGWLSVRYSVQHDWTVNKRNTLTEASQKQLASMADPVRMIAFSYPGGENRPTVQFFAEQYQRFKPDFELTFVDPSSNPQKVKDYGVSFAGEVVLEYQGRRENLRSLSEQAVTGALQRLTYSGERWIVFIEGHGERSVVEAQSQQAFTRFAGVLRDKGLNVQPLSLVQNPRIPDNTSVLVIASPRSAMLQGEIKLIEDYVKQGGNLLWLADPDHDPGLAPLAETLGVTWLDGYAVFPEYELLGTGHPGIFAAIGYPPSAVTQGLDQVTLFPLVRAIQTGPDSDWTASPLLTSSGEAWLETGAMDGEAVTFDPDAGDIGGPLNIGVTLTRMRAVPEAADDAESSEPSEAQQRVILVGDADFLSDAGIGQLGNQQLGLNLIQWLAARDEQINIDVPSAPDTNLFLPDWATMLISAGFVIALPLLLLGAGVGRWAVRRRR
ncbi:MAG: GldG family protein [Panacagrimonas sp.]